MTTKFYKSGDTFDVVAAAAVVSNEFVIVGALRGVAGASAAIGETFSMGVEGVYKLPKEAALAMAQGDAAYWDVAAKEINADILEPKAGIVFQPALAADTEVLIKLDVSAAVN